MITKPMSKQELIKWMEKNLPKDYTQKDYEDFYLRYKKTHTITKKKDYRMAPLVKDIMERVK